MTRPLRLRRHHRRWGCTRLPIEGRPEPMERFDERTERWLGVLALAAYAALVVFVAVGVWR